MDKSIETALKPSLAILMLRLALDAGQTPVIWGPPGVGKSAFVRDEKDVRAEKAKSVGKTFGLIEVRVSQMDPVDLRGLPSVEDHTTYWNKPHWFPVDGDAHEDEGILFLDEFNAAPRAMQPTLYQLAQDKMIGEHKLKDGWEVVMAGNRESDNAVVERLSSALGSRMFHIDVRDDLDDWCQWASKNHVEQVVISFQRFRPALHCKQEKEARTFPCPRTWAEGVSRTLKADPSPGIELMAYAARIGIPAATEFVAFLKTWRELPNVDDVIAHPEKAKVPDQPAVLYALCGAISAKATISNIANIVTFGDKLKKEGKIEYTILMMKDAILRDSELMRHKAVLDFMTKNVSAFPSP